MAATSDAIVRGNGYSILGMKKGFKCLQLHDASIDWASDYTLQQCLSGRKRLVKDLLGTILQKNTILQPILSNILNMSMNTTIAES